MFDRADELFDVFPEALGECDGDADGFTTSALPLSFPNVGDDTFAARIDLDGVFPVSMLYVLARKGDTIVWADQQLGVDKVVRWSGGCQRRPELAAHRLAPALRAWVGFEVQRVSPISGPSLPKLTVDAPASFWATGEDDSAVVTFLGKYATEEEGRIIKSGLRVQATRSALLR